MIASVTDLRYRTKEILRTLDAKEEIILTHRGKVKAKITPFGENTASPTRLADHDAIGMWADISESAPEMVAKLRRPRTC